MSDKTRVLIVDDHDLLRAGISSVLQSRGYEVAGEAGDGREAVSRALELRPDLILMDIHMPEMGGLEATRLIKAEQPDVKVVMLTVAEEEEDVFEAMKSGAEGYIFKRWNREVILDLISVVASGEALIFPKMAAKMLEEFSPKHGRKQAGLTEREQEVLNLVAQGKSNQEIADELGRSERTVKHHLRNILDKLHLETRAQLIASEAGRS